MFKADNIQSPSEREKEEEKEKEVRCSAQSEPLY
jgi:hypothetical protein